VAYRDADHDISCKWRASSTSTRGTSISLPHSFTHQQRTSFHFQVYQLYFPSTVSDIFIHFSSTPVSGIKIHASRLVSAAENIPFPKQLPSPSPFTFRSPSYNNNKHCHQHINTSPRPLFIRLGLGFLYSSTHPVVENESHAILHRGADLRQGLSAHLQIMDGIPSPQVGYSQKAHYL
jgi:hypothetical protein